MNKKIKEYNTLMCGVFLDSIKIGNCKNVSLSANDKSYFSESYESICDFIEQQKSPDFIISYSEKNKRQSLTPHTDDILREAINNVYYLKFHSLINTAIINSMESSSGNYFFWFSDNKSFQKISSLSFKELIHAICNSSIQINLTYRPSEILIMDIKKLNRSDVIAIYLKSRMAMCCKEK